MKTLLYDKGANFETSATVVDGKIWDLTVKRRDMSPKIGDIYLGRVENIVQGLDAAFVDIGFDKKGFLYKGDTITYKNQVSENIYECIKPGSTVIVQIAKEEEGDKGAKLTELISLNGELLVYLPNEKHIGISKKIKSPDDKKRLQELAQKLLDRDGLIYRTDAASTDDEFLINEFFTLKSEYTDIKRGSEIAYPPKLVYSNSKYKNDTIKVLASNDDVLFITNDESLYEDIKDNIMRKGLKPSQKMKLLKYNDLYNDYNIKSHIVELLKVRTKLDGGGYIDIEEGEALTAIDVNSGSYISGKNYDKTAYDVNLSAVLTALKHVRLRNIGGIIIIDSINIFDDKLKAKFEQKVHEICRNSSDGISFHGVTKLGLVQITRQKNGQSIKNLLTENSSKVFFGREFVVDFIIDEMIRKIIKETSSTKCSSIAIIIREDLFPYIINNRHLMNEYNEVSIKYLKSTEEITDHFKISTDPKYF